MTEQLYKVTWTIDIPAESPKEAALRAARIQRNEDSTATVFKVEDESGNEEVLDLWGKV